MCVTLALAAGATLLTAGTTYVTSSVNSFVQNEQLRHDIEVEKARAAEQMADRLTEYNRMASSNLVTVGTSGLGQNISFNEAIQPDNFETVNRDVGRIGFNRDMEVARKKYGISVNNARPGLNAFSDGLSQASQFAGSFATSLLPQRPTSNLAVRRVA